MSLAYLNGRFLPFAEAALPLHDAGFVWGAAVVDNCRTYRGQLFRWADHLARFRRDCSVCHVPLQRSEDELTEAAQRLITVNRADRELQVVTFATPGPLGFYVGDSLDGPPMIGMVTYPVPHERYRRFFTDGVTLAAAINPHHQPTHFNDTLLSPTVKHRSRLAWWVAEKAKSAVGYPSYALPLFFDQTGGSPTETAYANLLAVVNGTVVTPPRHLVLDGISLRVTEELCKELEIPFRESPIVPFAPPNVSEAMVAGTGFGIAGVKDYLPTPAEKPISFDWPGPVFRRLVKAWTKLTGIEIDREGL